MKTLKEELIDFASWLKLKGYSKQNLYAQELVSWYLKSINSEHHSESRSVSSNEANEEFENMEVVCNTCGSRCQIVRPGKWQCPKCE